MTESATVERSSSSLGIRIIDLVIIRGSDDERKAPSGKPEYLELHSLSYLPCGTSAGNVWGLGETQSSSQSQPGSRTRSLAVLPTIP